MHQHLPSELTRTALQERVASIASSLPADLRSDDVLQRWLLPVCAVSSYLLRVGTQYPDELSRLLRDGALTTPPELSANTAFHDDVPASWCADLITEIEADLDTHLTAEPSETVDAGALEKQQQRVLRRFRHRHLFSILWRELTGVTDVYQTLFDLSRLADACVRVADEWAYQALIKRYGVPRNREGDVQRLIVLGMGKLGGLELNVSSDIDLIIVWPEAGQTSGDENGKRVVDNAEFFRRSVQLFTRLLNSVTEDGFVFRVDTRLRPFGDSGPLVMNFEGLENYYLTQARDWERYAMIKARAITGDAKDIKALMDIVTPFVYRRYLDYNAFDSLRDLKRKIAISVREKGLVDNIKLGAGGIREVEFIGQAFQLVRGGRDKSLRIRSIVSVLNKLAESSLLEASEVEDLLNAYTYLRRVENAVQMMRDEQVHSLPTDEDDRLRLLAMLDETDWAAFRQQLGLHQNSVTRSFSGLFEVEDEPVDADSSGSVPEQAVEPNTRCDSPEQMHDFWIVIASEDTEPALRSRVLAELGFTPDEELISVIDSVSRGPFFQRLTADSQQRVTRIVPMIMCEALKASDPADTLHRCMALVRTVAGRSGYLQVLCDQPLALARLVRLFSQSRWLARFVLSQPIVIDELLTVQGAALYLPADQMRARTLAEVERVQDAELDVQMDSLRHYRQAREMRIACAQLDGTLSLMQVSDQLTWLAESLIEAVLLLVEVPLQKRHGRPVCDVNERTRHTSHAVVAYGKLGGLELGFGSDLDLVFLHDSTGEKQVTDGEKPIDNSLYYARLAQKFVHFMGTATPAGKLYEIDLRLRPNGTSGVLVTGISAFADYQYGDAWTWEHQALIRARMVFGSSALHQRFADIRAGVIAQPRSETELRDAVAQMRERMRSALGSNQPDHLHLKQDAGGVADIEFVVQYLVLAYSAKHPELLTYTDNIRVLETVEQKGLLPVNDTTVLKECYLALRERLHHQALQEADAVVPLDDALTRVRDAVIDVRSRILA